MELVRQQDVAMNLQMENNQLQNKLKNAKLMLDSKIKQISDLQDENALLVIFNCY